MRSTIKKKLTAALLATSLGVGWVSAGNLDQMNYVQVAGGSVSDLFTPPQSAVFPNNPWDILPFIPLVDPQFAPIIPADAIIQTTGDGPQNSATWLRGWIEPPQTGEYTFWVSGGDDAEFYFNQNPGTVGSRGFDLKREAYTGGSTGATSWASRFSQRSVAITLQKGEQYYFELLQKSNGAGGIASLGWWLPDFTLERPIPLRYAQRYAFAGGCNPGTGGCTGPWNTQDSGLTQPRIDRGPGGATFNDATAFATEGSPFDLSPMLSFNYTGTSVAYQWYKNGTMEAGETTSVKYFEKATPADDNATYYLTANGTTTPTVTLRVTRDTDSPAVEFASTSGNNSGFSIIYTENVDPVTATDIANYSINGGLTITGIEMQFGQPEGNIVVITTDPAPSTGGLEVTINNVLDTALDPNEIAPDTKSLISLTDGIMSFRAFGGINGGANIGGTAVANFAYNVQNGVPPQDWTIGNTNRFGDPFADPVNPGAPDVDITVTQFGIRYNGSDLNFADNYGAQLVGFVTPPESGNYNFAIAADDQAVLFISTNADPANKYPIAIEPAWRPFRAYTNDDNGRTGANGYRDQVFGTSQNLALPANQSRGTVGNVILQAGNKYFIEALMKEGGGGDNLDVIWQLPSSGWFTKAVNDGISNGDLPIAGQYLSLFVPPGQAGPIEIIDQPLSVSILENRPAGLNVVHKGSPSFEYQWYKNGGILPDSNDRELLFPRPQNSDNGSEFTVVIRNLFSQEESVPAILTVIPDTDGPGIIRAVGSANYNSVTITFDEIIDDASAANSANYTIDNGLAILDSVGTLGTIVNGGNTSVTFTTSPQTPGTVYTVTVNNVKDIAQSENAIPTDTTVAFTGWEKYKGIVLGQIYRDIGGTAVSAMTSSPKYPDSPDEVVVLTRLGFPESLPYGGDNYGDNFGIRISGELQVPESGDWRFFTRSDDAGAFYLNTSGSAAPDESMAPIAVESGCCGGFNEPPAEETSAPQTLTAGVAYGFTYLVKEGGGGDWGGVAMRREGDTTPSGQLQAITVDCCAVANPDETTFTIDPQIVGGTFSEGTAVTFNTGGSGTNLSSANPPVYWSWEFKREGETEWTEVAGAHSSTLTTPRLLPADNNSEWRPVSTIPGRITYGDAVTLVVTPDAVKPNVSLVAGTASLSNVEVTFDEPVDTASGTSVNNYVILNSAQQVVAVTGASISSSGLVVTLTTVAQTQGETYDIAVSGVKDTSFAANEMVAYQGTFTAWQNALGYVHQREYWDIGGGAVQNLLDSSKFPDSPDRNHYIDSIDTPPSNNGAGFNNGQNRENFGTYMTGWLTVPADGDYHFAISGDDQQVFYLSTDEDPANLVAIVAEPQWNGWRSWETNDRRIGVGNPWFGNITTLPINRSQNTVGATTLTAGESYYFEAIAKEGGGGDSCTVMWWLDGEDMPGNDFPGISAANVRNFVNPDNRIMITEQPQSGNIIEGEAGSISVTANPTAATFGGPLSYQWYKDTVMIPGATGSSVGVAAAVPGDAGDYYATIDAPGAPQVTSATATITVGGAVTPPTLAIVNNGDGSVTVSYPTSDQASGNQLQAATSLSEPITFTDDTTGADNAGSFDTTKTTDTDSETYWRTAKP